MDSKVVWTALLGFILMATVGFLVSKFGCVTTISFTHPSSRWTSCEQKEIWFGIIPSETQTYDAVLGAITGQVCDQGGCVVNVLLKTDQGKIPVTQHSNDSDTVNSKVAAINAFIESPESDVLIIKENNGLFMIFEFLGLFIVCFYLVVNSGILKVCKSSR